MANREGLHGNGMGTMAGTCHNFRFFDQSARSSAGHHSIAGSSLKRSPHRHEFCSRLGSIGVISEHRLEGSERLRNRYGNREWRSDSARSVNNRPTIR
jgi:hypothetical protein